MDLINQLPDDLLLQILSLVPTKDVVVATSLVSKKWYSLSSLVSRLLFSDSSYKADYNKFTGFVNGTLLSNKAPVLDMLYFYLGPKCNDLDIRTWIEKAMITHRMRELTVILSRSPVLLPRSLFTCKTLETLRLRNCSVPDVNCFLPFVKTMILWDVAYASLPKLLAGCPNLEELAVRRDKEEGEDIVVAVPWSRTLILVDMRKGSKGGVYMIEAPSLEILEIVDHVFYVSRRIEYMPNLVKAHVDIAQGVTHEFLRALSSSRILSLCVSLISKVPSMIIIFSRLVHLELSTCAQGWWDLLTQMLQSSPKLASLKLNDKHELEIPSEETPDCWKWQSSIPDSLETLEWNDYKGRKGDLKMATYLIKNAIGLKTAILSPQSKDLETKCRMLKELETCICSPRSNDVEAKYRMFKASVADYTLHLRISSSA